MPSLDHLLAFAAATLVFAALPGPAVLYTAAQTLAHGRRAGLRAVLGLHCGCYLHVLAAAFGLSALFRHVPELYLLLKIGGALYLVWLGIGLIRRGAPAPGAAPAETPARSASHAFLNSALVEILNPKTALFFVAFLPQFVDPDAAWPVTVQFLVLGTFVNLAFSASDLIVVALAALLMRRVGQGERVTRWLRAAGGTILVGLGLRLALERA